MRRWLHRFFLSVCALLALGVVVGLGVVLVQTQAEYAQQSEVELKVRHRLAATEARLAEQERVLNRLRSDPAYVEGVIRRRLGYAKPDELIFRFED